MTSKKEERLERERAELERQRAERERLEKARAEVAAGWLAVIITAAAGAFVGWQVGDNWEETLAGAVAAPMLWFGLLPFQALSTIGGLVTHELWGRHLPWMIVALLLTYLIVRQGVDVF